MNKVLIFLASLVTAIFLIGIVSATDYGYTKSYTVKETYDDYGYTYYQKSVDKTPWGETTSYKQIKDYDSSPVFFKYNRDPYRNKVSDYWNDGPYQGISKTYGYVEKGYPDNMHNNRVYLDNRYNDEYVRTTTGSQYYDYYYSPPKVYTSNGGMYWDHGYQGYDCGNNYCYFN